MTEQVTRPGAPQDASLGELVSRMSEQTSRLVRDEMRLAQAEMKQKGKAAGIGVGLFGGAGLVALFGLGALVAAAILGLATVLAPWLAAIVVGVALFAIAGVAALIGRSEVAQATPPAPTQAVQSVRDDVDAVKAGARS